MLNHVESLARSVCSLQVQAPAVPVAAHQPGAAVLKVRGFLLGFPRGFQLCPHVSPVPGSGAMDPAKVPSGKCGFFHGFSMVFICFNALVFINWFQRVPTSAELRSEGVGKANRGTVFSEVRIAAKLARPASRSSGRFKEVSVQTDNPVAQIPAATWQKTATNAGTWQCSRSAVGWKSHALGIFG